MLLAFHPDPFRSLFYHFCVPSPFLVSVLTLGTYNSPSEDFPGGVGCPLPESTQSQTAVPFLLGQLLTNDWQVPECEKPSSLAQRFKEYIGVSLWEQVKAPLKGTSLEITHVHGFLLFTDPLPRFPIRLPWTRFTINHLHSSTCLAVCFWGTQPKVSGEMFFNMQKFLKQLFLPLPALCHVILRDNHY